LRAAARMALNRQGLDPGAGRRAEVRHQVGDAVHTYDLTLEPLRDADGRVVGLAGAALDITERKRAEARQRLLVAELSHRVKNMLATVQVIARRSLSSDRTLDEAREALAKRLRALAKAHDLLTASRWRGAGLRAVLAGELRPYGERAVLDGPELELAPNAAQTFALVLHELATNAAKHGALAAADGWLEVSWSRVTLPSRGDELRLVWRERDGLPVRAPSRRGFGRTLLEEGLRHELGGEVRLDFRPDGLVCELSVPAKAALSGS
jgi:two-component sensor histidine kinase